MVYFLNLYISISHSIEANLYNFVIFLSYFMSGIVLFAVSASLWGNIYSVSSIMCQNKQTKHRTPTLILRPKPLCHILFWCMGGFLNGDLLYNIHFTHIIFQALNL